MPCSLLCPCRWERVGNLRLTHSLSPNVRNTSVAASWLPGIVERSNGEGRGRARSWMFQGKSRGSRCFLTGAICSPFPSLPCIAPHTAPLCIHHLWSLACRRRHRLESELHSLQDLFRTQKCQRQKIWEIVLSIALALSHIFTRGVHCS